MVEAIDGIDISVTEVSCLILRDLSEYITLPFLAAFDVPDVSTSKTNRPPQKRVTYIALAKRTMPQVVKLYLSFKQDPIIYNDGTVEAILAVSFWVAVHLENTVSKSPYIGVFNSCQIEVRMSRAVEVRQRPALVEDCDNKPAASGQGVWTTDADVGRRYALWSTWLCE